MNNVVFLWNGWSPLFRIISVGSISYLTLLILLRIMGKRTLARMTAFDFVITIATGSAFGRILTASDISISESITAFLLLVCLHVSFSFLSMRFDRFKGLITTDPTLLYHRQNFLLRNMRRTKIRQDELLGAARKEGFASLDEVEAIIFESDGSLSVLAKSESDKNSTYSGIIK